MKKIEIEAKKPDKILNIISSEISYLSYAYAAKLLRNKDIKINGTRVKENVLVIPGSLITVYVPDDIICKHFEIVFEDENILIVNKKKGIETSGESSLEEEIGKVKAVHRLDRNTEGLVVFAKSQNAEEELLKAFKEGWINKYYLTEVVGCPEKDADNLSAYLLKESEKSKVMIFKNKMPGSVLIKTNYRVLKRGPETSILEVQLLTGKTHQIRAHLAYIGHPIVGDGKYGNWKNNFKEKSQKLFCYKLEFIKMTGKLEYLSGKIIKTIPEWIKDITLKFNKSG